MITIKWNCFSTKSCICCRSRLVCEHFRPLYCGGSGVLVNMVMTRDGAGVFVNVVMIVRFSSGGDQLNYKKD